MQYLHPNAEKLFHGKKKIIKLSCSTKRVHKKWNENISKKENLYLRTWKSLNELNYNPSFSLFFLFLHLDCSRYHPRLESFFWCFSWFYCKIMMKTSKYIAKTNKKALLKGKMKERWKISHVFISFFCHCAFNMCRKSTKIEFSIQIFISLFFWVEFLQPLCELVHLRATYIAYKHNKNVIKVLKCFEMNKLFSVCFLLVLKVRWRSFYGELNI